MGPHPAVAAVRRAVRLALADLPQDSFVLAACSGGADSTALAAALGHEAPRRGLHAGGLTVDHGLQPGSRAQSERVAALLSGLGLAPVEVLSVAVGHIGGPEAAARAARHQALREAADRHNAVVVLLGHTRDDQAETVLLGLARGSGTRSLSGMAPVAGRLRRPLLDLDRATTQAACAALRLPVWDDPHNADRSFTRVRVRHEALPALEAALGPGVPAALARTARLLRDDADALDTWAGEVRARVTCPGGGLDAAALSLVPAAVRRRVLRASAVAAGCPSGALSARHIEELDRLLTRWRGQGPLHLPGGVAAHRHYGTLLLGPGRR